MQSWASSLRFCRPETFRYCRPERSEGSAVRRKIQIPHFVRDDNSGEDLIVHRAGPGRASYLLLAPSWISDRTGTFFGFCLALDFLRDLEAPPTMSATEVL